MKTTTRIDDRASRAQLVDSVLAIRFEEALKADLDRLLWLQQEVLDHRGDSREAIRSALRRAYRTLLRFHAR